MPGSALALAQNSQVGVRTARIEAFDALRGIALIAMALDHAAYFTQVGIVAEFHQGIDLYLETWPHWLTGLLTNIAAPTFWFLAGFSLALFVQGSRLKGESEWAITRFLLIRAGIIALFDLTVGAIWGFSFNVLSSLAVSIAIMSMMRFLPSWLIACLGATTMVGYEWLWMHLGDSSSTHVSLWSAIWITPNNGLPSPVPFPVLGWIGLMALGYALTVTLREKQLLQSPRPWLTIALALLILWLVMRLANGYGNINQYNSNQPWHYFLIMSKDPISLAYLTFNLGWMCFILVGLLRFPHLKQSQLFSLAVLFGQTPLLFFVSHILIYRILGKVAIRLGMLEGFGIVRAYLIWVAGLCILVPLCMIFRHAKRRYPTSVLRYV
ncbi:MAG: hypothetical protein KatS3mg053_2210 [Candidatus Roseilinea sp.]|nr:MAG: hypothetical protein KatS3mg053_2210 [Candidatus Roseilinea sp.]